MAMDLMDDSKSGLSDAATLCEGEQEMIRRSPVRSSNDIRYERSGLFNMDWLLVSVSLTDDELIIKIVSFPTHSSSLDAEILVWM